jgi:hypothetical protein
VSRPRAAEPSDRGASPRAAGASPEQTPRREVAGEKTARAKTSHISPAFTRLKWTSFFHSCVYTSLLVCAFALGKPQPETLVLGWTHGLLWIGMSLACITAARMRVIPLRLAVAVAVLGGIGPFFGSAEFVRTQKAYEKNPRRTSAHGGSDC